MDQAIMRIRTYFWEARIISRLEFQMRRVFRRAPYNHFLVGNAGDIFARELIEHRYGAAAFNDPHRGKRLLVVGSVGHSIRSGDVICGIGVKSRYVPEASDVPVRVWAVRGPITHDAFKAAGHDTSGVKFQYDPGLMIRFRMSDADRSIKPSGVIFIPHYREREKYVRGLPNGIRLVDIDSRPIEVARAILGAELVYSSSLHGIIFAHALERPCILVAPQTQEPMLKYEDYFASLNLPMPRPLSSVAEIRFAGTPSSPADIRYHASDFAFPSLEELMAQGIAVP